MTDRFVWLNTGTLLIDHSSFDHIANLAALIWINNKGFVTIQNSNFEKIVGLIQSALIFSIQNPFGNVELTNCTIKNTLSEQSLF